MCLGAMLTRSGIVIVKVDCQIEEIYNYHWNKSLDMSVRGFLNKVN